MPFRSRVVFSFIPFLCCSAVFTENAKGAVNAASCSSSDVQAAINAAANGDTVSVPAGTCSWSGGVSIPGTKGVTVSGTGAASIITGGSISLTANASTGSRITGFTFTTANAVSTGGPKTGAPFRIDHNTFRVTTGGSILLEVGGNAPGLIDHNSFNAPTNSEMIHNYGMGASNASGWTDDVIPGSYNAVYLEDNTFTNNDPALNTANPAYFWGNSAIQSYYGARTVIRHNTLLMSQIDQHGTAGMIGARWWEIYENTFNVVPNGNQSNYMQIRAGSGVIFNNHKTGSVNIGGGQIELVEEDSGYPALYQIGRGINEALSPTYAWGNDPNLGSVVSGSSNVVLNRDFYVSTTQPASMLRQQAASDGPSTTYSYQPFTYPYPLDANGLPNPGSAGTGTGSDTQAPSTPASLTATAVSSSQINLSWSASTDNVGVTGYRVYRNGIQASTPTGTSYSDTGLAASTSYSYTVAAVDAAGNVSTQSTTATATTQSTGVGTAFIPSSRTVDWTHAGIPGGIPSATWTVYKTLSPSGGADDSVPIQNALNAAPAGTVVQLNPGTYKLHRSSTVCQGLSDDYASGVYEAGLCINKAVVLRGSGPNQTILQYGDDANIVSLGRTYLSSSQVVLIAITAGASKDSTQIALKNTSGVAVGTYLVVTQTNPNDTDGNALVNTSGYTGSCSACGHDMAQFSMTQIERVIAVSGNSVTLERPLYFDYTNSPQVYKLPMVENAGLEELRLQATASSGTGIVFKNINMEACAHCWVHDVESDMSVDRSHMYLSDVYASEISNNYFYDGYSHNSGETYSIFLEFRNSENLIQNNIIRKARHSTVLSGGSGNVLAYNYMLDAYMGEYPNSLPETNTHGAHPYMNLWEGNVTPNMELDFAHGSGSHNTLFRNYIDLTSTNPSTDTTMTSGIFGINVAYYNNYENIIGNVLGEYGSSCTASRYESDADSALSSAILKFGYFDDGGTASPNPGLSAKVRQTAVLGGNWDCVNNSVLWNSNAPTSASTYLGQQTLPTSLYLSGKPSWFGNVPWPAIDTASATKMSKIPAQLCYESGPKTGAAFNPSTCYQSQSQSVGAPSNVTATVR